MEAIHTTLKTHPSPAGSFTTDLIALPLSINHPMMLSPFLTNHNHQMTMILQCFKYLNCDPSLLPLTSGSIQSGPSTSTFHTNHINTHLPIDVIPSTFFQSMLHSSYFVLEPDYGSYFTLDSYQSHNKFGEAICIASKSL